MVADNLTVSTWTGRLCSAFRKLATVMPLVWGFFVGSVYAQEAPYYNPATGGYYQTVREACESAIPALVAFYEANTSVRQGQSLTLTNQYSTGGSCRYSGVWSGGYSFTNSTMSTELGTSAAVQQAACEAGEERTMSWPLARKLEDGSLQSFGITPPHQACFEGCSANYAGMPEDPPYSYPDSDAPDIVYVAISYELQGGTCSSDTAEPPMPDIPDPPADGPGDIGGGDTGGGDTGGGDNGGGDTGGGDLGGGTQIPGGGSGSVGGGDTGGGDTGGDTGGGDTGGGDTGGDTGGGDTGGGDTGGGNAGGGNGEGDGDGSSAGGLACNQPLTCEGDPVQCAILKTQKEQLCADLDGADFEGHRGEIESLFSGPDYQREDDEEISVPSFVTGITRFFPANSCPADASISLSSFGGRTLKLSYEPICSFASALGPLIVIAATVFAALYVGRAFGGE